jgi:flagellar motor switch protein FliM
MRLEHCRRWPGCPFPSRVKRELRRAGQLAVSLAPAVMLPLLGRLLGGRLSEMPAEPRPLTEVEQRLARRVHRAACQALAAAWREVCGREVSPQVGQPGGRPDGGLAVYRWQIALGPHEGSLVLELPWPLVRELECWPAPAEHSAGVDADFESERLLTVTLARATLSAEQWSRLRVGDLIVTGHPVDRPASVEIDGRAKYHARPGTLDGRKAVQVTGPVSPG